MFKGLLSFMALALPMVAQAQATISPVNFQSSTRQIALLELYSSEGCSSCPPAEAWLTGLKDSPGLWQDFVPVAWHVDYWNYLGWRDPWSNEDFSERQRSYAALWHSENIYTPELVLNGKKWRPWFKPKNGPAATGAETGRLTANSGDAKHWHMQFIPAKATTARFQVHAALMACGLGSEVKAGENAGRHLNHDFVAVSSVDQYLPWRTNAFQVEIILDGNQVRSGQGAVAFWVTRINELEPIQAVGGWLAPTAVKK
jgi:hypothetical protein